MSFKCRSLSVRPFARLFRCAQASVSLKHFSVSTSFRDAGSLYSPCPTLKFCLCFLTEKLEQIFDKTLNISDVPSSVKHSSYRDTLLALNATDKYIGNMKKSHTLLECIALVFIFTKGKKHRRFRLDLR